MIKGVLDYRGETEYRLLIDEDLAGLVEVDTLPVGDFNIIAGGQTRCVFERKTITDLLNSFRDGRIFH